MCDLGSAKKYPVRRQMSWACRLLKEMGMSLKEISEATGCESQSLFTRRSRQGLRLNRVCFVGLGRFL